MKTYLVVMEPTRRMRAALVVWMLLVQAETKKAAIAAFMEGEAAGAYTPKDYLRPVAHENPLGRLLRV